MTKRKLFSRVVDFSSSGGRVKADPAPPPAPAADASNPIASALRSAPVLATAVVVLGLLALYWPTALSIVAIWWRSDTFAHGFVVIPISIWLVWRHRAALATIPAVPWWPGLALVALFGAFWLIASSADALGLKQFALAFMLQAAIVTVLGLRLARALAFPIAFLLFAIPAGEVFVPTLIDWTADFTVAALRWTGVPVYREANHFIIPSGAWSVVEACSGIRYIIASVMIGTIYAAVAYQTVRRRAAFILASILVPIVANWLRAYMIVMIGHLSSNRLAVGVDHIIYGWVFFGLVMLLLFWVGSFWQEPDPLVATPRSDADLRSHVPRGASPSRPLFMAAIAAIAVAALWPPVERAIAQPASTTVPVLAPIAGANGWIASPGAHPLWKPHYAGYASDLSSMYEKDGAPVGLYLAFFRNQEKGRELVTSGNVLVTKLDFNWRELSTAQESVDWTGTGTTIQRSDISGPNGRFDVYRLYWINGALTSSDYVAKALIAWSKLRGRGDDSALIVLYTPQSGQGKNMSERMRDFASAMSPAIERTIEAARERK